MAQFLFKRSGTASKRPDPAQMALGEVDLNYDSVTGGLFYKDSAGTVIKVGPAQVSATAPNATPAGSSGNALGEFWYDTGASALCIWDGSAWQATGGGGGSGIPCSLLTATGDLIVASAANTPAALPVGFNGQVLVACSTCTNGVGWANIPAATPAVSGVVRGLSTDGLTLNTALGFGSLNTTLTGERNTAVGVATLGSLTTGSRNASFGQASLAAVATGNDNTGLGYASLTNATGSDNTAVGSAAAEGVTGGTCNTALGSCSLASATLGSSNIAIGYKAGCLITTGSQNVVIGPLAQVPNVIDSCQLAIGFSATDYWLTGTCTKAIKPGAGILDCADSTGSSGQLLSSTGANALEWITPNYISPTALNASSVGALIVNGCDLGGGTCFTAILPGPTKPGQILTNAYNSGDPGYLAGQGYLNWCTPDYISQSSFGPGALVVGCTPGSTGGICTVGSITNANNPGVAVGYYQGVTVTSALTGTGALANVNVIDVGYFPSVDSIEITQPGTGYALSETVRFTVCGNQITTCAAVASLNQSTICKAGYLPVGTNGQVLTADSTCALGVKWAAAGGGASSATPLVAGIVFGCTLATGTGSTALGSGALGATPTGTCNVAVGLNAGCSISTGVGNTAIGASSLISNTASGCNTAVGFGSSALATGDNNTSVGFCSLAGNSASVGNVAIGSFAMNTNGGGGCNVGIGFSALRSVTSGGRNVAVGENAVRGLTTGGCNVGIGSFSLCAITTGTNNTGVGYAALFAGGDGSNNTAVGANSLCSTGGATNNSAFGVNAGRAITTGNGNSLLGTNAGCSFNTGAGNTVIGGGAFFTATSSACNTAIGLAAGQNTTGGCNTFLGAETGCLVSSGGLNTVIGHRVNPPVLTGSCQLAIGFCNTCWLTGCSTGAIRPGAGIMDCTGATGTAGQVLMSNGANALCWGTASGDGISQTIIDAKGDLIVGCAADCAIRLASGTNGQVLAVNTACPTGLQWVNGSGIASGIFTAKGQLIASCAAGVACALSPGGDGELLAVCSACPTGFTWAAPGGVALAQPYVAGAVYGNFYLYCEGYPPYYCSMSFGYGSLANTSGLDSKGTLAIGHDVLQQAICTFDNVAIGISAMQFGNENQGNVAVGNASMYGTCCATNNVAIGNGTLAQANGPFLASGDACGNVAIGTSALQFLSSGSQNIAIGDGTGNCMSTGDNNILIGAGTGNSVDGLAIISTENNRILMGNCFHTCAQIQVAWSTVSDVRDKALDPAGVPYGLLFVEQLEPIAYRWCNRCTNEVTDQKLRYGFSAQNVRSLEGDNAVIVSDDNPDKLMITDQHLLPVLVNAIKELSEKNKLLEERIAVLEDKA